MFYSQSTHCKCFILFYFYVSDSERSVAGVAAMDNVMYCVGGFDGSSHLKDACMYDPRIDKWMGIAEMSHPR